MAYSYDEHFLQYTVRAACSAERITSLVFPALAPHSVLDVGCAVGVWLAAWQRAGAADICGVDGDYVDSSRLHIPGDRFFRHDLNLPFDLGRRFDLVQSLEVAEHLPAAAAAGFVASLVRHSKRVLFSAAPPGQGGENHINEQPYDYWRALFAVHGYKPIDWLRPLLANDSAVARWYRYNLMIYVHGSEIASLPQSLQAAVIPDGQAIADVSPLSYRARKSVVRLLPFWATQMLARVTARWNGRQPNSL